jgi:hypothetical protein
MAFVPFCYAKHGSAYRYKLARSSPSLMKSEFAAAGAPSRTIARIFSKALLHRQDKDASDRANESIQVSAPESALKPRMRAKDRLHQRAFYPSNSRF